LISRASKKVVKMVKTADHTAVLEKNKILTAKNEELLKENQALIEMIAAFEKRIEALENQNKTPAANQEFPWLTAAKGGKKSEVRLNLLNVVSDENKERNKKEKNIVVFGLKNSTKESITEKKADDVDQINQMLEVLSITNVPVEGAFRINAKDKEKPRPLVVVLKDKEARNKILQAAKKLKEVEEYKSVFLCPDLTEAQRLKYKELVKIRDDKNSKMSVEDKEKKIWCIRDNLVVLLNKRK